MGVTSEVLIPHDWRAGGSSLVTGSTGVGTAIPEPLVTGRTVVGAAIPEPLVTGRTGEASYLGALLLGALL